MITEQLDQQVAQFTKQFASITEQVGRRIVGNEEVIEGTLTAGDHDLELTAGSIHVMGALHVGSERQQVGSARAVKVVDAVSDGCTGSQSSTMV